jgi:photosynthetic reaction center H subunit
MNTGSITGYFDVAQIALYVFWIFFAGLVFFLRREDKREGYPLESDRSGGRIKIQGFPPMPHPKTYLLQGGGQVQLPRPESDTRTILARPSAGHLGAPLVPTGNPMLDAVGPASYALRATHPDYALDGLPMIVPLRSSPATGFDVAAADRDPRGMPVYGADGELGGTVSDVWVDRAEPQIRYLEVTVTGGRRVLLPVTYVKYDMRRGQVNVWAILGAQFAGVPGLAAPDEVTMREEDAIQAYYAGGKLYATPARAEPLI